PFSVTASVPSALRVASKRFGRSPAKWLSTSLSPRQRPTSVPVSPSTRRIEPDTSAPDWRRNTCHVRVSRGADTSLWTRRISHVRDLRRVAAVGGHRREAAHPDFLGPRARPLVLIRADELS